ncbi:MAG: hypothetical protein AAF322_08175, partial [Pseudomonadota bacterium]
EELAAARAALGAAEAEAAAAAGRRDEAAQPIRDALAAAAILDAAPSVGPNLVALTKAIGDEAHARRLALRPGGAEVEVVAPDAAALAAALARVEGFRSAKLKTPARAEASSGLQRAVIEVDFETRSTE